MYQESCEPHRSSKSAGEEVLLARFVQNFLSLPLDRFRIWKRFHSSDHKYNHSVWLWFQKYKDIQINLLIKVNTDNRCMYKSVCKIHAKIIVTSI